MESDASLAAGLNTAGGRIVNAAVAAALGEAVHPFDVGLLDTMIAGRHRDRLLIAVVALAVALAVADSSVVVLALPGSLRDVQRLDRHRVVDDHRVQPRDRRGSDRCSRDRAARTAATCSPASDWALFAVASLWCGLSTSFGMLIVGRTVQGLGAAMALVGAVPVLSGIRGSDEHAIRLWALAGTIGVAVGPALGGFLTQLFSWRSIFLLQAPLAALALVAVFDPRVRAVERPPRPRTARTRGIANTGFLALYGALVGALFLSVLLLVVVWGWSPIAGAIVVTTLAGRHDRGAQAAYPACRSGSRSGSAASRSRAGSSRSAFLPASTAAWAAAALAACGIGLGLLGGVLAPAAVPANAPGTRAATVSIAARHAGFVLALAIIAPVLSTSLNTAALVATRATTAEVLDSSVSLRTKVSLAFDLRDLIADAPRGEVPDPTGAVQQTRARRPTRSCGKPETVLSPRSATR